MTRETIPSFDLYAELEVSRSASAATIEAAYRSLAKRHHPDVSGVSGGANRARSANRDGPSDERIKRINLARDWLTDPDRRRRYDRTRHRPTLTMSTATQGGYVDPSPGMRRGAREAWASGDRGESLDPTWATYGPNDAEVRQFLADLRELDRARGLEVRGGTRAAEAAGHARARSEAFRAGRTRRLSEWLFARDAAAIIVRTRLGDLPLAGDIVEAMADAAGAIAVRDLLPRTDFELLLLPWTWRGDHILARPSTVSSGRSANRTAAPPPMGTSPRQRRTDEDDPPPPPTDWGKWAVIVAAAASTLGLVVALIALGAALNLFGPPHSAFVAGATDVPSNAPAETVGPTGTVAPTASPAVAGIDPAKLQALQLGASKTITRLAAAARIGAVATAQTLLGKSAPGLRSSGLRLATFPVIDPSAIVVSQAGAGWLATAQTDTLTSSDGTHWIFDYGDRPLARFTSTTFHDLYFIEPLGLHDIKITLAAVTISGAGITTAFTWTYGPDTRQVDDGPYFVGDQLVITSLTLSGRPITITNGLVSELGPAALKAALFIPAPGIQPGRVVVNVALVRPSARIVTTFVLGF